MKKKVIIATWMLGLAGIAWACGERHEVVTHSGSRPLAPPTLGAA